MGATISGGGKRTSNKGTTMTRLLLVLAVALATMSAVPASAQIYNGLGTLGHEHTCGSAYLEYDSSGAPTGPYCH